MADFDGREHAAVGEQLFGGAQIGRQPAVGPGAGDALAQHGERGAGAGAGLQRRAQVDGSRGAHQLDGEHPAQVVDRRGAACGPRPSRSTRGPPASRWWAATLRDAGTARRLASIAIAACV